MTNLSLPQIQKEEEEPEVIQNEDLRSKEITPTEVFEEKPKPKQRRKRKPLTQEQKDKLAIARQKSLEVRQAKARARNQNKTNKEYVKEDANNNNPLKEKIEQKKIEIKESENIEKVFLEEKPEPEPEVEEEDAVSEEEIVYVKKEKPVVKKKKKKVVYVSPSSSESESSEEEIVYKKKDKKKKYKPLQKTYTENDMINYGNYMVNKNVEETKRRQSAISKKQDEG